MPPKNKTSYTLYLDNVPLGNTPIAPGIIHEITLPEDTVNPEIMHILLKPMEFSVTVKTPKRWRCRSRKRLIKLLMSEGITRNCAKRLADFTRTLMPYKEAWRAYIWSRL